MSEILMGIIGAALLIIFFIVGVITGIRICESRCADEVMSEVSPEDIRKGKEVEEENKAFSSLMGYNINDAYGLNKHYGGEKT